MELPKRIILPCGNAALLNSKENQYYCNYCNFVIGSADEPTECRRKREEATRPINKDYWMNINDGIEE